MEDKTRVLSVVFMIQKTFHRINQKQQNQKNIKTWNSAKYNTKGIQQLFSVKRKNHHIKSFGKLRFHFCILVHEALPSGALVEITRGWWWTAAQVSCWCRESGNDTSLCRSQARIVGWLHLLPGSVAANPAAVLSTQGWIHLSFSSAELSSGSPSARTIPLHCFYMGPWWFFS